MTQNRQVDERQPFVDGRTQQRYLVHYNGILARQPHKGMMQNQHNSPLLSVTTAATTTTTTTTTTVMTPFSSTLQSLIISQPTTPNNDLFIIDEMQCQSPIRSPFNCTSQELQNQVFDFNPAEINFADIQRLWISKDFLDILVRVAFVAPIVLLGIVGNLTIIYSMFKFKKFRSKPTNIFILNMAIADLLTTMVCPTSALFTDIYQFYVLGSFICRFEGFVKITCLLVSSYSLIVLSSDWLLCVIQPCRTRITIKQSWLALATIWFLSILMACPLFVWRKLRRRLWKDLVEVWCCELIQYTKYYWVVITFFLIYLPTFFMTVVLVIILAQMDKYEAKLRRSRSPSSTQGNCSLSINMKYRRRIVKILFTYLLTSIICWTPLQFTIIYRHFRSEAIPSPWFFELAFFAQLSASLTAAMDPIIFGFLSQPFRRIVTKSLMFKFLDKIVGSNGARSSAENHPNNRNEITARNNRPDNAGSRSQQKNHHLQQHGVQIHQKHLKPPFSSQLRAGSARLIVKSATRSGGSGRIVSTQNNFKQPTAINCCSIDPNNRRVSFNTSLKSGGLQTSIGCENVGSPPSFESKLGIICETHSPPQQQPNVSQSQIHYSGAQQNGKQISTTSFMQRRPLSFVSMDSINIEENLGDGEVNG